MWYISYMDSKGRDSSGVAEISCQYILDHLPYKVFILDEKKRVVYANEPALTGIALEDIIGRPYWEVICGKVSENPDCGMKGEEGMFSFNLRGKNQIAVYKRINEGYIISIFEVKEEASEELILMIRHSLGNAVNAMKVSLQVLRDFYEKIPEEKKKEYIERIYEDAQRLERLLKHLRSLSYLRKEDFRIFNLKDVMTEFISRAQQRCLYMGIEFLFELEPGDIYIRANPDWVFSILLVLLENSIEALSGRERRMIEVKVKKQGKKVFISFFDTGKGMSDSILSRAYNLFFSTKRSGEGVGLFQVRKMVELMGGRTWIESKEDAWTEVFIELPIA